MTELYNPIENLIYIKAGGLFRYKTCLYVDEYDSCWSDVTQEIFTPERQAWLNRIKSGRGIWFMCDAPICALIFEHKTGEVDVYRLMDSRREEIEKIFKEHHASDISYRIDNVINTYFR